jgi:hypothetical protein
MASRRAQNADEEPSMMTESLALEDSYEVEPMAIELDE